MSLQFPNAKRSFDPDGECIRFIGYDGVFQISFAVAVSALAAKARTEDSYLKAFDAAVSDIHGAATKVYSQSRKNNYRLTSIN